MNLDLRANGPYIESILQKYGLQKIRHKKDGMMACCPFHKENNPSFSISNTGLWMCWTCKKKGNLRQFIELMGGGVGDWKDGLRQLGIQLQCSPYKIVENSKSAPRRDIKELPADFLPYEHKDDVPSSIICRLKMETIKFFGLGSSNWGPNRDRCVIPIRYNGNVVGYHSRALFPEAPLRYYNPKDFDIKQHVFNYDECVNGGEVLIVEGAFNAMSMWEKGFKTTMAVFGTQFTTGQIKRLLSLSPSSIVMCFDRDSSKMKDGKETGRAGQRAAKKLGILTEAIIPTYVMPLPLDKDPNHLPAETLVRCYEKRVLYGTIFGGGK